MRGGAEWVANDQEGYVVGVGIFEDVVRGGLDGLAVGEDYGAAVVGFLLCCWSADIFLHMKHGVYDRCTY